MITLASIGDLPALPLGMSYPKRKNWLLGRATKSKKLKFTPVKKESMNFIVVKKISEFFEAVDQKLRNKRLKNIVRSIGRNEKAWASGGSSKLAVKSDKAYRIINKRRDSRNRSDGSGSYFSRGVAYNVGNNRKDWIDLHKASQARKSGLKYTASGHISNVKDRRKRIRVNVLGEAVDAKLRADRVWRVFQKGRKLAGQANKFYTRSMGYRQDISSTIPGFPGFNVHPTKKMPIKRGNKAASYDLHHYAQRKSDKALYIARKFANKVKGAKPSREAKPDIGGTAQIASYVFKTRRNRD